MLDTRLTHWSSAFCLKDVAVQEGPVMNQGF